MTTPAKRLKLQPPAVVFSNNYAEDQKSHMRLTNETEKVVAYRIRTTRPAFYRMSNADGFLEPGASKDFEILLKKNFPWDRAEVARHKFVALTLHPFDEDVRNNKPVNEIFSDGQQPCQFEIPLTLHPPPGN